MPSQCFVLMPFGKPFDDYYSQILVPAIEAAGFDSKRADGIYGAGVIISDIFAEIKKSSVLVADVSTKNPNVNYELGYAHAFRLPVVIISQTLDDVPFDYRQHRVIIYDTKQAGWEQALKSALVQNLKAAGKRSAVSEERRGYVEVYRFFSKRPRSKYFLDLLDEVDPGSEINLLGMALTVLLDPHVQQAVEKKVKDGCRVRILTLDPKSKFVRPTAVNEHRDFQDLKADLLADRNNHRNLVRRLSSLSGRIEFAHYDLPPSYFIFMTARTMTVGFYLSGDRGVFLPHLELRNRESNAYKEFAQFFDSLWDGRLKVADARSRNTDAPPDVKTASRARRR